MASLYRVEGIESIYGKRKINYMPERMAWFVKAGVFALYALDEELRSLGAKLVCSDMYRDTEMQARAHQRYVLGMKAYRANQKARIEGRPYDASLKKPKFSPASGGSFHEAGRAIDVSLRHIRPLHKRADQVLDTFWSIAAKHGFFPIIKNPIETASESWHFDFLGDNEELKAMRYHDYRKAAQMAITALKGKSDERIKRSITKEV